MHQHSASSVQSFLNKRIADREMLKNIFLFQVINFDHGMFDIAKRDRIKRSLQGGEDMGHVSLAQDFILLQ